MTKRSVPIAYICLVLITSIFVFHSQEVRANEPRDFRRPDQTMLSVRVSCQDTDPQAYVSWTSVPGASSYTLSRKAEESTEWAVIGENIGNTAFIDTIFETLPDEYEYQMHAEFTARREVLSSVVAVSIPSCGISDAPASQVETSIPQTEEAFAGDPSITTAALATNMIRNPSFEAVAADGNPQYWYHGGWGKNNGKYIYPSLGSDGGKAAKVEMTARTTGDIKWFFEDVPVTAGKAYTISHLYRSTETTEVTARFTGPAGIQYQYIKMLPEAANWTTSTTRIVAPPNTTSMTLFHILYSLGSLEIDSFSMIPEASSVGTPFPVAPPPAPSPVLNLIRNPSLEIAGANGNPVDWYRGGWGTNARFFTYPVVGAEGSKAAKVEITSYTNGDAKWYFEDVPVVAGKEYTLSHLYKATVPTEILARFTTNIGIEYHHISTVSAALNWSTSNISITAPNNALSITLFHLLSSVGILETDAFTMTEKTEGVSAVPSPSPAETPSSAPTIANKYIMLNAISWEPASLSTLPLNDASEVTYFVLPVSAFGELIDTSLTLEGAFVKAVHAAGKKATFSIAGGSQDIQDITSAVTMNAAILINNIATHIRLHNYDGIVVDIEDTDITALSMTNFIRALRTKIDTIRPNLVLGIYTQPYQINTVWGNIAQVANAITWLSPMIYDIGPFNATDFRTLTKAWEPKIGKEKLLGGIAVNYPSEKGGLTVEQFKQVLDIVNTEGWRGVGIWQNTLYTQPWLDARRAVWQTIE